MTDERSANAVDRRLGQRMRARRLEVGLSQERLADLLGVTFQQIQKYEKGVNRIAASRLYDIARALDVSIGYFYEGMSGPASEMSGVREDDSVAETLSTPEGLQLLTLFSRIENPRLRRRVIDLVRAMVEEEPVASLADANPREGC